MVAGSSELTETAGSSVRYNSLSPVTNDQRLRVSFVEGVTPFTMSAGTISREGAATSFGVSPISKFLFW